MIIGQSYSPKLLASFLNGGVRLIALSYSGWSRYLGTSPYYRATSLVIGLRSTDTGLSNIRCQLQKLTAPSSRFEVDGCKAVLIFNP